MQNIITGHEAEIAALAERAASPEYRAHCLQMAIDLRAKQVEILEQAAAGTLQPFETIFGDIESVESQVAWAKQNIEMYDAQIAKLQAR